MGPGRTGEHGWMDFYGASLIDVTCPTADSSIRRASAKCQSGNRVTYDSPDGAAAVGEGGFWRDINARGVGSGRFLLRPIYSSCRYPNKWQIDSYLLQFLRALVSLLRV